MSEARGIRNNAAYEQPGQSITLTPKTSFIEKQYTFVSVAADTDMVTTAVGAKAIGVAQLPAIASEPCRVMTSGISFVKLGGTVAEGAEVAVGANGTAVLAAGEAKAVGVAIVGGSSGALGSVKLY